MKRAELAKLVHDGLLEDKPDRKLWTESLRELISRGFLEKSSEDGFSFSNSLTWEVVYETLLYADRRRLHEFVALHIEKKHAKNLPPVASVLFYHFDAASNAPRAIYFGGMAGDWAADLHALDDAIGFYQRIESALDSLGRDVSLELSLVKERLADAFEKQGHYSYATNNFFAALVLWRASSRKAKSKFLPWTVKPATQESLLCKKIGVSCEHDADYSKSLVYLNTALELLPARPGPVAAQVCASKAGTLFRMGKHQEAIDWGRRAIKVAKRCKSDADIAYSQNMIANSYIETGELRKAVDYLKQAVETYGQLNDYPGIAKSNSNLGSCFMFLGDLEAARRHYDVALEADKKMMNAASLAMDHNNLGEVLLYKGDVKEAFAHLENVVKTYERGLCPPDLTGLALVNMSRCKLVDREYEHALTYLLRAMKLLRRAGQPGLIAEAQLQEVEIHLALGDLDKARRMCRRALKQIEALNAKVLEARALRILGKVLAKTQQTDKALQCLEHSIALANQIGAEYEEAKSLIIWGQVLIDAGREIPTSICEGLMRARGIMEKMGAYFYCKRVDRLLVRCDILKN